MPEPTLQEALRPAIFQALCACLSLSPSSEEASSRIRRAYTEPENSPRPPRSLDVVYWTLLPDPAAPVSPPAYETLPAQASAVHIPTVTELLACTLLLVFYGPACLENARRVRSFLYLDGPGFPRAILRRAGVFPIPRPPQPLLLHEEEGSLWRTRADLSIPLRIRETLAAAPRPFVTSAPAVILRTQTPAVGQQAGTPQAEALSE